MIATLLTAPNILFIIGFIGTLFGIYQYFRKPQENLEKQQASSDNELKDKASILSQKEVESKALLLAKQVEWERQATDKKFMDFSLRLDSAFTMAQNHIHSLDIKLDKTTEMITLLTIQVAKLDTIINERIPKLQ